MFFIPIFFPLRLLQPKCPKCKEDEDKVIVCRHCGFEYKKKSRFKRILQSNSLFILFFIFVVWFMLTTVSWLVYLDYCHGRCHTLVDHIILQFYWIYDVAKNLW